jgi:hypothetical protein
MAVIESKGDGFSLFNGVKLPSLPEYDEMEYPYALIMSCDEFDELSLYLMAKPLEGFIDEDGVNLYHNGLGTTLRYNIVDNSWHFVERYHNGLDLYQCEAYWTNTDIIDGGSKSVYLSASEPIALDGMNVIEWDGDTTGLEKITNTTLYDINVDINLDSTKGYVRRTAIGDVKQGSWTVMPEFYNGSNVRVMVDDGSVCLTRATSNHVDLFAYYPIKEEPEETDPISYIEYLANPKYRMGNPFRGFFGWLWQRK